MVSKFQQKSANKNAGKSRGDAAEPRKGKPGQKQSRHPQDDSVDEDRVEAGEQEQDDEEREYREAEDDVERDVRHSRQQPGRS